MSSAQELASTSVVDVVRNDRRFVEYYVRSDVGRTRTTLPLRLLRCVANSCTGLLSVNTG
jgi:hypothetical protein